MNAVGDRICNIHLNDFDEEHSCLLPGEGTMDYGAFFGELARLGYDRQVLIEVYKDNFDSLDRIRRAVEWLARSHNAEKGRGKPLPYKFRPYIRQIPDFYGDVY